MSAPASEPIQVPARKIRQNVNTLFNLVCDDTNTNEYHQSGLNGAAKTNNKSIITKTKTGDIYEARFKRRLSSDSNSAGRVANKSRPNGTMNCGIINYKNNNNNTNIKNNHHFIFDQGSQGHSSSSAYISSSSSSSAASSATSSSTHNNNNNRHQQPPSSQAHNNNHNQQKNSASSSSNGSISSFGIDHQNGFRFEDDTDQFHLMIHDDDDDVDNDEQTRSSYCDRNNKYQNMNHHNNNNNNNGQDEYFEEDQYYSNYEDDYEVDRASSLQYDDEDEDADEHFLNQEYNESHKNRYLRDNDFEEKPPRAGDDPMRLFESIQALARSLHKNTDMIGSLPPKRLIASPVRSIALA